MLREFLLRTVRPCFSPSDGGGGGGGGGGEGGGATVDLADPKVKAAIQSAVEQATGGLSKKNAELLDEVKKARDGLKTWDGLDPEKVRSIMTRIEQDEETRLISEGKIDEVLNRRVGRMKDDFEARLRAAEAAQQGVVQERDTFRTRYQRTVIDSAVQRAAAEVGLLPSAVEDVLHRAGNVFKIEEDRLVPRDEAGNLLLGKDAKTPMSVTEWLSSIKDKTPHWWPAPSGSGSTGARGTGRSAASQGELTQDEIAQLPMSEYRRLRKEGRI